MGCDPAGLLPRVHERLEAWQRQDLRSYCCCVVLPLVICGGAYTSLFYGFGVLMLPIRDEFHAGARWSVATGSPVYVGSLMLFASSCVGTLIGGRMAGRPDDTSGRWLRYACFGGTIMFCVGLVLSAVAMQHEQLWLLYVGCSLIAGLGTGGIYMSNMVSALVHFRAAGFPGLGSGLVGCIFGLWPVAFATSWPSLSGEVGTPGGFLVVAGVVFVLSLPPSFLLRLPPPQIAPTESAQEDANSIHGASATSVEGTEIGMSVQSADVLNVPSEASTHVEPTAQMTRMEIVRQSKFWMTTGGVACLLLPGFGMKLLLGPTMFAVFHSDQSTQDETSALFLLAYSAMRLLTGVCADRFNLWTVYLVIGVSQSALVFLLGVSVFNEWPQHVFVGLSSGLGMLLAGNKVLFSLLCFKVWAPKDASLALGLVCLAYGIAATFGSGTAWVSLCQMQMVGGEPVEGHQRPLRLAVAAWFSTCSLLSVVGTTCIIALRMGLGAGRRDEKVAR